MKNEIKMGIIAYVFGVTPYSLFTNRPLSVIHIHYFSMVVWIPTYYSITMYKQYLFFIFTNA